MTSLRFLTALGLLTCSLSAQTTWTSFADRRGHAMATTAAGGVVMFGGESVTEPGELLGDTLRLSTNNQTWTEPGVSTTPPPTGSSAMASTTIGGTPTYVMFGGTTPTGIVARTWRYSGTGWGDVTSAIAPLARSQHAMVTNTTTGAMFLFGGFDGTVAKNDTWEFTPPTDTWTERIVPGSKPSVRRGHCMAYHPGTDRVYVFGGTPFLNDLWAFDGNTNTWTQITPVSALPPGRRFASMSYLEGTGTLIVFGGLSSGGVIRNDTWSYDPSSNQWTQVGLTNPPPVRYEHATAPDNTGDNLVLLGGTNALPPSLVGTVIEGTWLFSSITLQWFLQIPSPSARDGAAMAYDSVRSRHVVFGGRTVPAATAIDETWEIDGLNWRQLAPSAKPSPRTDAGMAFDSAPGRNVTVLYGGRTASGQDLGDTWEWNGASWAQRFPSTSPPLAGGSQLAYDTKQLVTRAPITTPTAWTPALHMWSWTGTDWLPDPAVRPGFMKGAYDQARGEVVLVASPFLGAGGATFLWDGTSWRRPAQPTGPSARSTTQLVYDALRQEVVLFGGHYQNTTILGDTWTWNGTTWTQRSPANAPSPRAGHYMAYDSTAGVTVLFGGINSWNGPGGTYIGNDETWTWNGSNWQLLSPAVRPPIRWSGAGAFDQARNRFVIIGGGLHSPSWALTNEVWEFDGVTWTNATPGGLAPSVRMEAAAAYDPVLQSVVVHGGWNGAVYGDTWLWNGASWTAVTPGNSPGARWAGVMVTMGSQPTLFGGVDGNSVGHSDVWLWTGANWLQQAIEPPAGRTNFGCAYDARRDMAVVFGGMSSNDRVNASYYAETLEWNGGAWTRRTPVNSPSPRGWCKLTYDEARGRVVLFGGADATSVFSDTWEWDGSNWSQRAPAANPAGSYGHDLTFDKVRKLSIAFGSFGTWDYGTVNPAAVTTYGAGCPSSASVPASAPFALKIRPWTGAWLGESFEMEFENAPLGIGLFLWGFDYTNSLLGPLPVSLGLLGIGPANCFLRNSFDVIEVFLGTTFTSSILVNASPALLGLRLYGQGAFFDALLPGVPVVTTNGAEFVVGQK